MKLQHTTSLVLTERELMVLRSAHSILQEMVGEDDIYNFVNSHLTCGTELGDIVINLETIIDMAES